MHLSDYLREQDLPIATVAKEIGCSRSYLTHVAAHRKTLSRRLAIAIWRSRKVKLDPIANASDAEIRAIERFEASAAA